MIRAVRVSIYRNGRIEDKIIRIKEDNYWFNRFAIEKEIEKIKDRFRDYRKRKIINDSSRNPKVNDSKYKLKVKMMVYSRRTLKQAIKLLSKKPKA